MNIFDTHAHFEGGEEEIKAVLDRAFDAGVTKIMAVGGSEDLNRTAQIAHNLFPDKVCMALGFDRDQCSNTSENELLTKKVRDFTNLVAVGECGLDFYYSKETAKNQCDLFAQELTLADELRLPVVIHTRDADDATLGVLDEIPWHGEGVRGVIHCFTGSVKFEKELLDRGFMISISGIVTFRAAENVRDAARYVPDDRLLIETDSPFLAPVPMRGKANEPAFILHTLNFLSDLRKTTPQILSNLTFLNSQIVLNMI